MIALKPESGGRAYTDSSGPLAVKESPKNAVQKKANMLNEKIFRTRK